jgi:hypothetical protein
MLDFRTMMTVAIEAKYLHNEEYGGLGHWFSTGAIFRMDHWQKSEKGGGHRKCFKWATKISLLKHNY